MSSVALPRSPQSLLSNPTISKNTLKFQHNTQYRLIFTATTKDRIAELELQIDELNGRILSEECKEANLLTKEDVETFLMDALKAEPQLLIDTLIDKITLFDDKVEIFYKYSQNNNPDDLTKEIRRDFCLPLGRRVAVTDRHIIYATDL